MCFANNTSKSYNMKKISVFAVLLMLFATACKKEYVTQEVRNTTVVYTLKASDWTLDNSDGTYNASIGMPEIDQTVFENDGVVASAMFNEGLYDALPQVYGGVTYLYYYQPGAVTISIQGANGSAVTKPTRDITFKIVLVPSMQR